MKYLIFLLMVIGCRPPTERERCTVPELAYAYQKRAEGCSTVWIMGRGEPGEDNPDEIVTDDK